ncbi:MAG: Gfo/Idh/MocA family protein [Actinomycetes bacterium]
MTTLRAGLVGLGAIGRHHARVLRSMDGVELVAVADPAGDPNRLADGVPVVADVDDLVRLGIDMCVVAAPTRYHRDLGLALAAAGVHTLIEKPLANDVASCLELAQAFTAAGVVGCVGHIERYNPALQALRERIEADELGALYQVATRRQGPFPARIADVGVVLDLASHDIDLTAWVTGQDFATVSARTAHKSGRLHEDLVAVVGQLTDGTVTNHLVNWLSPMKERVTVVTGEKGCYVADTLNADLTFYTNANVAMEWDTMSMFRGVAEGDVVRFAIAKPEPLRTELQAFRDAALGKDADIVTVEQGTRTVAVAQALLASASTGTTVAVPQPGTARVGA